MAETEVRKWLAAVHPPKILPLSWHQSSPDLLSRVRSRSGVDRWVKYPPLSRQSGMPWLSVIIRFRTRAAKVFFPSWSWILGRMAFSGSDAASLVQPAILVSMSSPPIPSLAQRQAITILEHEDRQNIIAWLKLARSVKEPFEHCVVRDGLTGQQIDAIRVLRHCTDPDICVWLDGSSGTPRNRRQATAPLTDDDFVPNTNTDHIATVSNIPLSPDLPLRDSSFDELCPLKFPTAAEYPAQVTSQHGHGVLFPSIAQASHLTSTDTVPTKYLPDPPALYNAKPKPSYSCTTCKNGRIYKRISDWKREERKHEVTYTCILDGPVEHTVMGPRCLLCHALNPDEKHFDLHNVQLCLGSTASSYSCSRRNHMVTHLSKHHGVHDSTHGQAVADRWLSRSGRQAWSCGFCVQLFRTFDDRLRHLDTRHFAQYQTLAAWDMTNVIKGLLLQPSVAVAWENIMNSHYEQHWPAITWESPSVDDLQLVLEQGPTAARSSEDLATAAFVARKVTCNPRDTYLHQSSTPTVVESARMDEDPSACLYLPTTSSDLDCHQENKPLPQSSRESVEDLHNVHDISNIWPVGDSVLPSAPQYHSDAWMSQEQNPSPPSYGSPLTAQWFV